MNTPLNHRPSALPSQYALPPCAPASGRDAGTPTGRPRRRALAVAALLALAAGTAQAQDKISDGVVKIGLLNDMSGVYADVDGPAGAEAIKMAIADFGGTLNGKKIEFISADHQNKADIAASRARVVLLPARPLVAVR